MTVWLDGRLVDTFEARVDPDDRGLLLGDGLFETLLAIDGRVIERAAHWARLAAGAAALSIPLPMAENDVGAAMTELLTVNGLGSAGRAVLRLTLTRGPGLGTRGLIGPAEPRPTLMISARPAHDPPPAPAILHRCSFALSPESPSVRHKTLSRIDLVMARREAKVAAADEALLTNSDGNLMSASAANLFMVVEGVLRTPPLRDGALAGITRGVVLDLAELLGIAADVETNLGPAVLAAANEVFLTNSVIGIRPVAGLSTEATRWRAGQVTGALQAALIERWRATR